jgi:hypothetical protein
MRQTVFLILLGLGIAGCRGTQAYTSVDLVQVRSAYATLQPIYVHFKADYLRGDKGGILSYLQREQAACRVVDAIDSRDTIDPNVKLFQASIELDNLCNAIESAYAYWASHHHYSYDKSITPYPPNDAFLIADTDLLKMPGYLKRPSNLA